MPIIVARLAAIDLQIPQLVAQKAQAEAELVKLEICLAKQIAYIELCKGKSIKYIAEIELLAKRTNKKLIDLQDDLMAKAAKCRSCLESFVNLSNSATQKKLPEDSFMFVSCDALEDELKNISSIGGSIDSNNSLLEKQRKSFFENQDIIFENTSNNVIGNNKEIVILLKEMSVIYDCLRKMLSLLQEYDQI